MESLIENMDALRAKAREGGGAAVLERWKARGKGKMGARERCVCFLRERHGLGECPY
jgi:3-methylcrotonyl-CoA carboxylase beta subunit